MCLISWFLDVVRRGFLYSKWYLLESLCWPQGLIFLNSEVDHGSIWAVWAGSSRPPPPWWELMWAAVAASCCLLLLLCPWVFEILFGEDAVDCLYTEIKSTFYQCTDLRGWPVNWAFIQSEPLWSFSQHHPWTIACCVTGIRLHDLDHAPSVAWATARNWHCFLPIFVFGM